MLRKMAAVVGACSLAVLAALVGPAPARADWPALRNVWISVLPQSGPGPKVIDVTGRSTAVFAPIQLFQRQTTNNANQYWEIIPSGVTQADTVYKLRNRASGLCLLRNLAGRNGDSVMLHYCSSEPFNQWRFVRVVNGNNWGLLVSLYDGRCLDVKDVTYADAQPLQVWTCSSNWNQRWNIF